MQDDDADFSFIIIWIDNFATKNVATNLIDINLVTKYS